MGWGEVESESFFGWNSERPRKTIGLCCLTIARELPRGTHLPWVPTLCTDKLYKMWGGKVRVNPTWVKTLGFHQTAHIYKFCCENWTAHIEICWESESWNEKQKHNLNLKHKLNRNKTKQMLQGKWKWDTYYIYKFCCELWTAHVVLLRYWTGVKCIDNKLTNNTGHLRTG